MITPSFALTATERVLPKLALDFTTASLDPRVTFTRTTSASNPATYVNSSGLITAATNNEPRFDYTLNTGGDCKGLLIEESRTNLALYSEQFDNAYWGKSTFGTASAPVVTQNAGVAPDGTTTAEQVDFSCGSTVSDRSLLSRVFTITNTTAYAGTVYIKAATAGDIGKTVRFRTENVGAAVTVTLTSSWQRVASSGTSASTTCTWFVETRGTLSSQTASVLLWGAQLEQGAFATSYIPTEATALTRNADVATMTGTNFSDWFNATEGTLLAAVSSPNSTCIAFQIDDGTDANFIRVLSRATGASGGSAAVNVGNINQSTFSAFTFAANNKSIMAYKLNDLATTINGGTVSTDTSALIPTVSMVRFGASAAAAFTGTIQKISYYPQRLTNREVQAFSK